MRHIVVFALLGLGYLLAGCDKYYYQEGKTFKECAKDRHECVADLKERLGVVSRRPGGYEYEFIENCMKHKGYRLVTERQLPLGVKRLDPDQSMRGKLYGYRRGIAGTVDEEQSDSAKELGGGTRGYGIYRLP
ncbi:MAG: hypothetical protein ACYSWQ_26735 [Planctomycetota bacterium]|jgi:hypothetical protein